MQRRSFLPQEWPEDEIYESIVWGLPGYQHKEKRNHDTNDRSTSSTSCLQPRLSVGH